MAPSTQCFWVTSLLDMCTSSGGGPSGQPSLFFQPCFHVKSSYSVSCQLLCVGIGAAFYLGYSWLPSFFTKHVGIPQSLTLWMVLSGMIVFTFVVPVSADGMYDMM